MSANDPEQTSHDNQYRTLSVSLVPAEIANLSWAQLSPRFIATAPGFTFFGTDRLLDRKAAVAPRREESQC
jgi:hypothetical protein